jgi:DNA polymerase III subunit beta
MKIEVLREKLNQAISIVGRMAIKSATLPILEGVMIKADDSNICLSATDLEVGIEVSVLAKISKTGQAVVPARIISGLARLMSDDKISMELSKNLLLINDTKNETSLQTLDSSEFPVIPKTDHSFEIDVDGGEFSDALKQVADCVASSQSRPEISGVYVHIKGDQLILAATDSYRLAQKTISLPKKEKEKEFILPAKAANNLIAVIGESTQSVKIIGDDSQIEFSMVLGEAPLDLNIRIVSRLIEGTYPRYQDVIPQKTPIAIQLDRHEFMGKIKAASLLSDQTYEVRLFSESKKDLLRIEARSSRVGEFKSSIPAEISGGEIEIAFNGKFLSDALMNLDSASIWLHLTDSDKAALLKAEKDPNYIYVLMPIRSS